MRTFSTVVIGVGVIASGPAAAQSYNERPASVVVVMSNSRTYAGTYQLKEVARVCGEVPGDRNFAGVPSFIVQLYPESGSGEVTDVTFGSSSLVGGVMTTGKFDLSVKVESPRIGKPSAYVLDTSRPNIKGNATLTAPTKGTVTLHVTGANDLGEAIDLTLTCGPRASKE
jgi:hypothetical protein